MVLTRKAKKILHKTLHNITSFFMEGYQKLPKSPSLNPFISCSRRNHKHEQFLEPFPYEWEGPNESLEEETIKEEEASSEGLKQIVPPKNKHKMRERYRRDPSSRDTNGGSYALARKMKELDMVDEGDLEHVLDVEEALHYYSRLRSPVYLDIVDNFFIDMYSELNVPQHTSSSSLCNSKRRKGSFRF